MGMNTVQFPWDEDSPEPLVDLCAYKVASDPSIFCEQTDGSWSLKKDLILPCEICEKLIDVWHNNDSAKIDDKYMNIFKDTRNTRLKKVILRNSLINDTTIDNVLNHNVLELDIHMCKNLTEKTLEHINNKGKNLISLIIGLGTNIFPGLGSFGDENFLSNTCLEKQGNIINAPNLQRLVIKELYCPIQPQYFALLLQPLHKLTHLDLTGCFFLDNLEYMQHLTTLVYLNLHSVQKIQDTIPVINKLLNLRFLDISQSNNKYGIFKSPKSVLTSIIINHPYLDALDISGTNLAQAETYEKDDLKSTVDAKLCDIPGLQSRVKNPLQFLGLYNTDACWRENIPALVVTGDHNEQQILAAAEAYLDRPVILVKAMNELFHIFRYSSCQEETKALNLIIAAMVRHKDVKHIQISGSASLFYIAKREYKTKLNIKTGQKMINVLLDAMENYAEDSTMMRNACLTICQFKIPQDVVFVYSRLVRLLLRLVKLPQIDDFIRRIAIYLLNSLACQVNGKQKELVGCLGAIETMINLIYKKLEGQQSDDVLEIAWSMMWNVTDETPLNCKRFLDNDGMMFFQQCLAVFPENSDLLRNMMGLLGNVAEVKDLRPRLLETDHINTFADLLDSTSDGIEVSYNAAGVLSHIASDGPDAWKITTPPRSLVLSRMVAAINRWSLEAERNINYRSFEPILRLLKVYHTPECQHWATWALANLTKVYPDKYCTLVEEEGGLVLLEELLQSHEPYQCIRDLATTVIDQCHQFKQEELNLIEN